MATPTRPAMADTVQYWRFRFFRKAICWASKPTPPRFHPSPKALVLVVVPRGRVARSVAGNEGKSAGADSAASSARGDWALVEAQQNTLDEIDPRLGCFYMMLAKASARLAGMTVEQRAELPCIGHERADLVVAGCAILDAILDIWPAERLGVADRGIREGILRSLMARDRARLAS